jgi:outer membrane protein assembly factor BamB
VGFHGNEHSIVLASPCTDGERVYGLLAGGNGNPAKNSKLAFAVDYYGKQVWRRELDGWETWASPVIYKDMVIYDLQGGSGFIALDRKTGEVKYFVPHGNNGWHYVSHAFTPVPMLSGGVPFLLTNSAGDHHIEGRNPEDGKVVWFAKGKTIGTQSMSGTVGDGFIYCDGGGNGKESFYSGAAFNLASLAKSNGNIAGIAGTETCCVEQQKFPSVGGLVDWEGSGPVISNGYIYREFGNFVWCIEAATGKVVYQEKLNMGTYGGYFSAPFATADGLIYFASAGRSVVLKAGPKFELVADNKLGDGGLAPRPKADDTTYSHSSPAVSDGKIFILGTTKLWCIGSK